MRPQLFDSLKKYDKNTLFSDLTAAVMTAVVALPLSIAFGIQSGVSVQAGLIAAIVGGLLISMLGGGRYSIGGPSAPFVLLTASCVANAKIGLNGMLLIVILAGAILVLAGLLKAGKLLKFMPYSVVLGFTAGIGVTLLAGQMKDFLGLTLPSGPLTFIKQLGAYIKNIHTLNWAVLLLGILALGIIFILPRFNKKLPSVIISVITATLLSLALERVFKDKIHIKTIGSSYGEIKAYLKPIDFLKLPGGLLPLIVPAFTIALISATEGLMSATVAEELTGNGFNGNTELIGHGLANIGTGLLGGLPVCGALARTSVNISSGAKTPVAGIFNAGIVLLFYLLLMPAVKFVPLFALAAVLIKAGVNMSRFKLVARFVTFGIRDLAILLSAFACTVLLGGFYGLITGIAAALLVNIQNFKRGLKLESCEFCEIADGDKFKSQNKKAYKLTGTIFFANISRLIAHIKEDCANFDEVVLDFSGVKRVDATAVEKLTKLTKATAKNGRRLAVHNLNEKAKIRFQKAFEHIVYSWR